MIKKEDGYIYYPVIIPTLCRFTHLKNCIESLLLCDDADKTEVIIGLDYPLSEEYFEGYNKIKEYLLGVKGFKKLTVFEHKENLGAAKNSGFIQDEALKNYDAYIYSEDDNVFAPSFLEYMNWGLNKYRDDESIFSICGYSYPIDWQEKEDVVLMQNRYFSAWGYGAWKNKFEKAKNTVCGEYFRSFLKQKDFSNALRESPRNLITYSGLLLSDEIKIFDITLSAYMFASSKYQLMPSVSFVKNMGWDNSGEHCETEFGKIFTEQIISIAPNFPNNPVVKIPNNEGYKALEDFQMSIVKKNKFYLFIAKVKLFFLRLFGYSVMKKIKKIYRKLKWKQNG